MADLTSRPYHPSADYCCEACVFGRGRHAGWCERQPVESDESYEASEALLKRWGSDKEAL